MATGISASSISIGFLYGVKAQAGLYSALYKSEHNKSVPNIDELTAGKSAPWSVGAEVTTINGITYIYYKVKVEGDILLSREQAKKVVTFNLYDGECEILALSHADFHCQLAGADFTPESMLSESHYAIGDIVYVWMQL